MGVCVCRFGALMQNAEPLHTTKLIVTKSYSMALFFSAAGLTRRAHNNISDRLE